ncbi:restriction endonuclease subunit S [Campylobacter vulpis]|uniref:restriction endonuclease subunit S n=1 Tax=Campylobacter vulpis TaxID=1655500 RepID=UPI000C14E8D6|nr:restriction endonuclease subunit S [Campylobacter vulpis]MBS4275126.1 restriction endonuclease subunit S [Campylobacter vulpis]MBS4307384.1 restriction endonuclease subunit S [Campylobacter vulpis]MBS4329494.1 restriction endonuclease subunit S [Campylobacter vulpis]MBS4423156.1 restriction endonuclease subunit S [Campylobacter vulpis]QNF78339.1 type I restriction/modification system, specificity subunit [Campylobacter vulpis]
MKTDTLKKSLLDYAIKGKLTARFRRENNGLNAFNEINTYNEAIKEKRKDLEKELKKLEIKLKKPQSVIAREQSERSNLQGKQELKSQIQILKKELTKCKEIQPIITPASLRGEAEANHTPKTANRLPQVSSETLAMTTTPPFTIPNSWAWVKLGDICEDLFAGGDKPQLFSSTQTENCQVPIYTNGVKNNGLYGFTNEAYVKKSAITISGRGTIGFVCVRNEPFYPIIRLLVAIPNEAINLNYLAYVLMPLIPKSSGTSIPQLTIPMIQNLSIPLPPLCEQQEIVKKLDLLVTLANDFAITKENLKRIEKRIEKSLLKLALEGSLSKLYRRSSPTLSAFDEINTYNEAIKEKRKNLEKELKKCEKELKLEKDKDKKALFKSQIQMLKKELTKCKEITPLNLSEAPFEIPNSWAWVKLGDICEMKKGPFGSAITKDMFIPNGSNAVKIYEQKNAIQKSETLGEYYISLEHFEKLKQFEVFENDIIVSCAGTIGEIFRIPKNAPKGIINQALMKIKLVNEEWIPYFMIFFDFLIKQKSQENSKGSAIKNIPPLDILKNFSIPLPPLCEQEHIVQTLDTLFTLKKGLRVD